MLNENIDVLAHEAPAMEVGVLKRKGSLKGIGEEEMRSPLQKKDQMVIGL